MLNHVHISCSLHKLVQPIEKNNDSEIVEMVEKARNDKLIERQELRDKKPTYVPPSDDESESDEEKMEQVSFTDDFSKEHLGAAHVTVTTVVGFDGDSDDEVDSLKDKLLERLKSNKKKNLAAEKKRLVKSQEARVKRMKEILMKRMITLMK